MMKKSTCEEHFRELMAAANQYGNTPNGLLSNVNNE